MSDHHFRSLLRLYRAGDTSVLPRLLATAMRNGNGHTDGDPQLHPTNPTYIGCLACGRMLCMCPACRGLPEHVDDLEPVSRCFPTCASLRTSYSSRAPTGAAGELKPGEQLQNMPRRDG